MFGNFRKKDDTTYTAVEEHHNPWAVTELDEFLFYCCPECDVRVQTKNIFINHAVSAHPKVIFSFFIKPYKPITVFRFLFEKLTGLFDVFWKISHSFF
jgi:hypothetical protein